MLRFCAMICFLLICAFPARAALFSGDGDAAVKGNNAFAASLYTQLRAGKGNLFFSPQSISTALALAYAGAGGETAKEMADVLHFSLPPESLHPALGGLQRDLTGNDGYQLAIANALWVGKGYELAPGFLKVTRDNYEAGIENLDFAAAPEDARLKINAWVGSKTMNKIPELLSQGSVYAGTRLIITNAIYFKGDWLSPFKKSGTQKRDFFPAPSQSVQVDMMFRSFDDYRYFERDGVQELELPYKGGNISMVIFLPRTSEGLDVFEKTITADNLEDWLSRLTPVHEVDFSLPRFKATQSFQLADTLTAMGMRRAFNKDDADFSGIDGGKDLFLSAVVHKAYIDVDEEGTEAAAATGTTLYLNSIDFDAPKPIIFNANHPFFYLIRDRKSGSILFMGRVADPSQG